MGLFSNNSKLCPICGGATPRLLAKKIQGEAICSNCASEIAADDELVKSWTLEDLRRHLVYREENKRQIDTFCATRSIDYGKEIMVDDTNRLFYIKQWAEENPPILKFDEITGYELEVGWHTVETWSRGMPRTPYQPPELGMMGTMVAVANAFGSKKDKDDDDSKSETIKLTLRLNNPYLKEYELVDASVFGDSMLDFQRDLNEEMTRVNTACNLIVSLTDAGAAAAFMGDAQPSAAQSTHQSVEDIKKFKELLDAGILTQEEFDAKKKQLLGL